MATHANGINGQSQYISKCNGTRVCWTHVEHYRTLFRSVDCIIFSKTPEEHIKRQVFQRFRELNLTINPTKRALFQTKVQFLRHVISKNGLEPDPKKVKAVQNFPIPQNQTDVTLFLALCSYYRR